MRKSQIAIIFLFCLSHLQAQTPSIDSWSRVAQSMNIDSLEIVLNTTIDDRQRTILLNEIALRYAFNQPEKGLLYSEEGLSLAEKLGYNLGIAGAKQSSAYCLWAMGDYSRSLGLALETLRLYENLENQERIAWTYLTIGIIYRDIGDYENAITNVRRGLGMYEELELSMRIPFAVVGSIFEKQNQIDSAIYYVQEALALDLKETQGSWGWLFYLLASIQSKNGDNDSAVTNYKKALPLAVSQNIRKDIVDINNGLASVFQEMGSVDSSIFYAKEVFQKWNSTSYQKGVLEAVVILADAYRTTNQRDSLIKYLEFGVKLNNELFNQEKEREIQNLAFNEQLREEEEIRRRNEYQTTLKMYVLFTVGLFLLIIALSLWRNVRHKKMANSLLLQEKEKVENTLAELKSTQAQLIQSEKMASLGQLTAGIAHEIQNPLNFVNNFSEISNELILEIQEARSKKQDKIDVELENEILGDIKQNLEKINHHGKRADAIVKGMLQHSRASSGEKVPTDINALADEYLRLSYHGMRAKDKSFSVEYKTEFDLNLPNVNLVPQDIGRVLLNIINNAFHACIEQGKREKKIGTGAQDDPNPYYPIPYSPLVKVSTKNLGDKIEISISDNGPGIPDSIKDKIFQPFFTTKPTGQGTGLGLSLAYDIVKAHGGELKAESKVNEGSEFIIILPINLIPETQSNTR